MYARAHIENLHDGAWVTRTAHVNAIKGILAGLGPVAGVDERLPGRLAAMRQWDGTPIPRGCSSGSSPSTSCGGWRAVRSAWKYVEKGEVPEGRGGGGLGGEVAREGRGAGAEGVVRGLSSIQ